MVSKRYLEYRYLLYRIYNKMLAEELVSTFLERCKERYSPEEYENIVSAVEYAQTAHANQVRESGEPYVSHPLAVAEILLNIEMDSDSLI